MVQATASRPPAASVDVQSWLLDTFTELRLLRSRLFTAITNEPMPEGAVLDAVPEKVAVVATELATNALRHARPPTRVYLRRTDRTFILDVADDDPTTMPEYVDRSPSGTGGLGLQIAREYACDLGWYVDDGTKHVWAQFAIPNWDNGSR